MNLNFATVTACGLSAVAALAQSVSIQNTELSVRYDSSAQSFSLTDRATGKALLPSGRLLAQPIANVTVREASDPVFGRGQRILVSYQGGASSALELYGSLPFLLVRTTLHNSGKGAMELTKTVPVQFSVDLQKPVESLRTMGTAGLTAPDKNPGSYLFLTVADPATRHGVVAGWLTEDRASGVLFSEIRGSAIECRARIDYGRLSLAPGASSQLETLAVGMFDDARIGQELYADALARQYRIHLPRPINGYCTWYSNPHGGAADERSIVELAEVAARELRPFGFSFVQIDDKWQDGQERNGPARRFYRVKPDGPYPHGLAPVSQKLKALGLKTGIWFLPFASDWKDPEFKDRQNWFVRRADGSPFETDWGNTSLDLTQPEVKAYLSGLVKTFRSWGIGYFKMDGLWTGTATEQIYVNDGYRDDQMGTNAPFHDPTKTNIEALRDGLKLLRHAAGPDIFFSGCNLSQNMRSLAGTIGLVDSMRIGPDNGQGWRDYREEIDKNASGSIVTGPVRGTRWYFLNGRVWWNDPDPCYVRPSIPLKQAQLITSWVALSGQFNLNSDWIPGLPADRLEILKRTMPAHGAVARPVDYFDSIMPRMWLVTDARHQVRRDVIGLFNWESTQQKLGCSVGWAGLDPAEKYYAFDFWADSPAPSFQGDFELEVPAQSCRVLAVRPAEGHPVLVSTTRHVTQGMVDVHEEKWVQGSGVLSGISQVITNDPYELRIAGLNEDARKWNFISAAVSGADTRAGVSIVAQPPRSNEEGWVRVTLHSDTTRTVHWAVRFQHE